jgi:RimJ/RimL family protein N-acetyltransferase
VGDQVVLRLLEQNDLPLTLLWRNQDNIRKWFINTDILQEDKHLAWFEHYKNLDNDFVFLILAKDLNNQPVGQISLYNINWEICHAEYGRLMIGNPIARGKGYAKQATTLLLDFAFNILNINEVILEVKPDNKAAIAVYQSAGFVITKQSSELITMTVRKLLFK